MALLPCQELEFQHSNTQGSPRAPSPSTEDHNQETHTSKKCKTLELPHQSDYLKITQVEHFTRNSSRVLSSSRY